MSPPIINCVPGTQLIILYPKSGSRVYQLRTFAAVDKLRPKSNHAHCQLSHRATVDDHVDTRSPRYAVYRPRTRYEVDKPFPPPVLTGMPDYQPQHNVEVDNPGPVDRSPSFGPRWDSNRTCCCSHCSAPVWEAPRTLAVSVWGPGRSRRPRPVPRLAASLTRAAAGIGPTRRGCPRADGDTTENEHAIRLRRPPLHPYEGGTMPAGTTITSPTRGRADS